MNIQIGSRVRLRKEIIPRFPLYANSVGTVVGEVLRTQCWRIKWDDRKTVCAWAKTFFVALKAEP